MKVLYTTWKVVYILTLIISASIIARPPFFAIAQEASNEMPAQVNKNPIESVVPSTSDSVTIDEFASMSPEEQQKFISSLPPQPEPTYVEPTESDTEENVINDMGEHVIEDIGYGGGENYISVYSIVLLVTSIALLCLLIIVAIRRFKKSEPHT